MIGCVTVVDLVVSARQGRTRVLGPRQTDDPSSLSSRVLAFGEGLDSPVF